jgi:tetratricopeptide (TPR) repeat protein
MRGRIAGRPRAKQVSSKRRGDNDRIESRDASQHQETVSPGGDPSRPELAPDVDSTELDQEVRKELSTLPKRLADLVGSHLVMAARVLDEDPRLALAHTRFARSKASRVAAVREAAGLAAYVAGEWSEALAELRAARRLGGGPGRLAVLADCERALGRPERALEIARSAEAGQLGIDEAVELRIVAAGARRDLGQFDAALVALQGPDLEAAGEEPWRARLRYAYADNLLAAGRREDAIRWFLAAAEADVEDATDAAERAVELSERPEAK